MKHYDDWAIALDIGNGNFLYAAHGPDNLLVPRPATERAAKFQSPLLAIETRERLIGDHADAQSSGCSIWLNAIIKKVQCGCRAKLKMNGVYNTGLDIHICRPCVQAERSGAGEC